MNSKVSTVRMMSHALIDMAQVFVPVRNRRESITGLVSRPLDVVDRPRVKVRLVGMLCQLRKNLTLEPIQGLILLV